MADEATANAGTARFRAIRPTAERSSAGPGVPGPPLAGRLRRRPRRRPCSARLYVPQFSRAVVGVFQRQTGGADAQQGLVDLAGSGVAKIEVRRAAAAAFCHSVGKYGILLTTDAIRQQYTRYNQADKQDAAGRAVLAACWMASRPRGRPPRGNLESVCY